MTEMHNPLAFPREGEGQLGMSLRDWFAGQALAGLLGAETDKCRYYSAYAAERAFGLADAMLVARANGVGGV